MNRFVKIGLLMVLVIALFGTYRFVSAQERESGPPTGVKVVEDVTPVEPPPALATNHVLKVTYISAAEPANGIPFSRNFTPIDGVSSISCPAPLGKTCTVAAEINLEAEGTAGDIIALCAKIDGSFPANSCPTVGTLGSINAVYSWTQTVSGVSKGTHTVQSYVYATGTGDSGSYNVNYRVYVP
jgi:hypothetical protein